MSAYNYSYTSLSLPEFGHQLSVVGYGGWGDALRASVSGTASGSGSCSRVSSSFPAQPLAPLRTGRNGESFFRTTSTGVGAIGTCSTRWSLTFTTPTYPSSSFSAPALNEIRCDNATGAIGTRPRRTGCVVPWYPAAVNYSRTSYPDLAAHVTRAQGSGLPGGTIAAPLFRTTNSSINNTNRSRACGTAPSITNYSCDEYPLASTYNGLAFGGLLRSFSGCRISAPTGVTGATGASACMIPASQNNAQGGLMSNFYYNERVLDTDPYRVLVTS